MVEFDYSEFITRNIGFVSEAEQEKLRSSKVLIIGTGGMGGAAIQSLARCGIGSLTIADIDEFEVSNLNRQVFANLDTVGQSKAHATAAAIAKINPLATVRVLGEEWFGLMDELLAEHSIVINGMDDIRSGVALYRAAERHNATVIDAYTSPLPSVIRVAPDAPRPEVRLDYPSVSLEVSDITSDIAAKCFEQEIEYVLTHSSSAEHIDLDIAVELLHGKRSRMSFAPMVITTGNLMAYEVVKFLLDKKSDVDERGVFFNPWTFEVERPYSAPVAAVRRILVKRFLRKLGATSG